MSEEMVRVEMREKVRAEMRRRKCDATKPTNHRSCGPRRRDV